MTTPSNALQRGRARAGAELKTVAVGPNTDAALQRGRARAGAEFAPASTPRQKMASLQRGRARAGAELDAPGPGWDERREASTGPRPRGRGILIKRSYYIQL